MSLLMWGIVYQGYNAVFPSFYPELFPTRTRVSSMAISQNIGTTITALLPALFATVAPPGTTNVPMIVGSIAFAITVIAAAAAWSARETYRVHMNDLGNPDAVAGARRRSMIGHAPTRSPRLRPPERSKGAPPARPAPPGTGSGPHDHRQRPGSSPTSATRPSRSRRR